MASHLCTSGTVSTRPLLRGVTEAGACQGAALIIYIPFAAGDPTGCHFSLASTLIKRFFPRFPINDGPGIGLRKEGSLELTGKERELE